MSARNIPSAEVSRHVLAAVPLFLQDLDVIPPSADERDRLRLQESERFLPGGRLATGESFSLHESAQETPQERLIIHDETAATIGVDASG